MLAVEILIIAIGVFVCYFVLKRSVTFSSNERSLLFHRGNLATTRCSVVNVTPIQDLKSDVAYQYTYSYYVDGKQYLYKGFYEYVVPHEFDTAVVKYAQDNPSHCYVVREMRTTLLWRTFFIVFMSLLVVGLVYWCAISDSPMDFFVSFVDTMVKCSGPM